MIESTVGASPMMEQRAPLPRAPFMYSFFYLVIVVLLMLLVVLLMLLLLVLLLLHRVQPTAAAASADCGVTAPAAGSRSTPVSAHGTLAHSPRSTKGRKSLMFLHAAAAGEGGGE
mgnify:CR=1 FL=1